MSDQKLAWGSVALTCLSASAGILAFLWPKGRTFLAILAVLFFGVAIYSLVRMAQDHPFLGLRRLSQELQRLRLKWARTKLGKTWRTGKRLDLTIKSSSVSIQGMHSSHPGSPPWPSLAGLKGASRIEVANRSRRTVKLQRIWIGIFETSTGLEILPTEVTRLDIGGGPPEVPPSAKQDYTVDMAAIFGRGIGRDDAEVYLMIETADRKWQRAKIESVLFN